MSKKDGHLLVFIQLISSLVSMLVMRLLVNAIVSVISSYGEASFYQQAITSLNYRRGIIFLIFPALLMIIPMMGYLSDKFGKLNLLIACHILLALAILITYSALQLQFNILFLTALLMFCVAQGSFPITLSIFTEEKFRSNLNYWVILIISLQFFIEALALFASHYIYSNAYINYLLITSFGTECLLLLLLITKLELNAELLAKTAVNLNNISSGLFQILSSKASRLWLLILFIYIFLNSLFYQTFANASFQQGNHSYLLVSCKLFMLVMVYFLCTKISYKNIIKILLPVSLIMLLVNILLTNTFSAFPIILIISLFTAITFLLWLYIINESVNAPMGLLTAILFATWAAAHMLSNLISTLFLQHHLYFVYLIFISCALLIALFSKNLLIKKLNVISP